MSFTLKVRLPLYAGVSGLTVEFTQPDSATVENTDGDTLTESGSGLFSASIAEDLVGTFTYVVKRAGAPIQTGWINRSANQASVLADDERECIADCSIEETINLVLPTTTDALQLIRNQIISRIQEITLSPKPNYTVDGQTFSWQSYLDSLLNNLGRIDDRIRDSEGPFEIVSRGCT